ncbi:M23 family metallopeptidase [Candidatus Gracilibacteria bacterium]|nr:M23 family metallopeptidase [Candidatus Gracilibacteria bacterium]NUJ98600.1 M23 family metallopeptidase [Candidatus Gracilibacteria bacterium]
MKRFLLITSGIIGIIGSFSLAFGNVIGLNDTIELGGIITKEIFLDSPILNKAFITYRSDKDISSYTFSSLCETKTKYLGNDEEFYFFELDFLSHECNHSYISLKNKEKIFPDSGFSLKFTKNSELYSILLDLDNENLEKMKDKYTILTKRLKIYNNLKEENIKKENLSYLIKKREYQENLYKKELIENILKKRQEKYSIPVFGYSLPTRDDKLPNAHRPYRASTTDGIHHSWDIDTPAGETVVALDDGIIIRIVDSWKKSDFANIINGDNLDKMQRERNLDIFRGNQVWIKTMKGELVMYAHLDTINASLKEGMFIEEKTPLGTVGITGVDEEGYSDYHLDFAICENPYILNKAGKYEIEDYMQWDWKMKGENKEYILEHQYDFFLN